MTICVDQSLIFTASRFLVLSTDFMLLIFCVFCHDRLMDINKLSQLQSIRQCLKTQLNLLHVFHSFVFLSFLMNPEWQVCSYKRIIPDFWYSSWRTVFQQYISNISIGAYIMNRRAPCAQIHIFKSLLLHSTYREMTSYMTVYTLHIEKWHHTWLCRSKYWLNKKFWSLIYVGRRMLKGSQLGKCYWWWNLIA